MQTYKNQQGKIIGVVIEGVYSKKVKRSKHLLRKWEAYGIDKSVLDEIIRNGAQWVVIHEIEEKKDYTAPLKEFIKKGIEADFGHSKQVFLPLVYFNKDNVN